MIGKRHFEVARMLKDIPTGTTFTIRLVEPIKSGFQGIAPRAGNKSSSKKAGFGTGKETLRFKANGNVAIEDELDDSSKCGIESINNILDNFMGINDAELATQVIQTYNSYIFEKLILLFQQIWELGSSKSNSMDFAEAVDNSDLEAFGFTDDFIIELWGSITDAKQGRLKS